jgi:predicted GH43/DUF377 family glycosyl hydrolase
MIKGLSLKTLKVERLNSGLPILSARKEHLWENQVVFNPACILLDDRARIYELINTLPLTVKEKNNAQIYDSICVLIYRAQGSKTKREDYRKSRLGIALLTPNLEVIYRHSKPIMIPEYEYENLGVEDPRITKVDGRYIMLYTGYSTERKAYKESRHKDKINICVAVSDDLLNWKKEGMLKGDLNEIDNKNAVLFPNKINGKYYLLHRPMEGTHPNTVHLAHADSILGEWTDLGMVLAANQHKQFSKSWIGAGAPPLTIDRNQFLFLYHTGHYKHDGSREYNIGMCTFRFDGTFKVHERVEPLMKPQTKMETEGNKSLGVNNVLFVCGAYFYDNYLYFPYAGADSVILGARIPMKKRSDSLNKRYN